MDHTENLTRYVANFVDELANSGLTDVVISPGSRSTPLAMTFAEHPNINHWINMDERSAAFFALGMAKQQHKPVALVCTSGTAAANYYPAVVEAYYSRVPLLVLTADRPHELRDVGAPQTIDQVKMYGEFVKWYHEMALPDASTAMLTYVRGKATRAYHTAIQNNYGPIHLNFPFREPLAPNFNLTNLWNNSEAKIKKAVFNGIRKLEPFEFDHLLSELSVYKRGLIMCGPQLDEQLAEAVVQLAEQWNIPVLADPLSQLRAGDHRKDMIIDCYDSILKSKQVREQLDPDFIIRFGAMPVSKPYLLWLKEKQIKQFVVEAYEGYREPTGGDVQFIYADPSHVCRDLQQLSSVSLDTDWMNKWVTMNEIAKEELLTDVETDKLSEGHAVKYIRKMAPENSIIYVGNSMPIRDMDTFFTSIDKKMKVLGNRGANGIDGMVSSSLGAAADQTKVTLLIGDLSFFHDMNALLVAKQYNLNITIVLINNNGGGIFSFLPQAKEDSPHFEVLFGTPLNIDFQHVAALYQANFQQPRTWDAFEQALKESYQTNGISIIELQTDREENVLWHKQKWDSIEKQLLSQFEG